MPWRSRSPVRVWRAAPRPRAPPTAAVERMLMWLARELRAERTFPWYRARRPRVFVLACPPSVN